MLSLGWVYQYQYISWGSQRGRGSIISHLDHQIFLLEYFNKNQLFIKLDQSWFGHFELMGNPEIIVNKDVTLLFLSWKEKLSNKLYNWQIRQLQPGRETGLGFKKCVRQPRAHLALFSFQRSVSHGHQKGLDFLNSLVNSLLVLLHWHKWEGGGSAVRYYWAWIISPFVHRQVKNWT